MGESIKKARELYHNEMEKHMKNNKFLKPADLQQFHEEAKDLIIRQLDQAQPLSRDQRTAVGKELDILLPKYGDIHYMLANNKDGLPEGEAPAIGIDLGTTYCCVGVFYKGKVYIIKDLGDYTTPSYVMFDSKGNANYIGKRAKESAHKDPENTIYDVKRIIGRKMDSPELQNDMKYWPFTVQEEDGVPKVKVNGKLLYPEQISAKLLGKLKATAEHFLGLNPGDITKAVITVPAYFNEGQRQATVDAGELAGLEVLTILNEPTAAAISYSLERLDTKPRKILVFDLGGGTFDVAILEMKPKQIDVLGVSGDTHLGGEDFDKELVAYCAARFKEEHKYDLMEEMKSTNKDVRVNARRRLRRLQTLCEEAKKDLTDGRMSVVSMGAIVNEIDLTVQVTREEYEEMNMKYFEKAIELVDATLKDVGVSKDEIEDIVMVGGSSRIPKIQEMLRSYFGGKALNVSIDPDQAVAYGAAVQAALMNGKQALGEFDYQIQDVTAISMGIETATGDLCVVLPKNTKIPVKRKQVFTTLLENQGSVQIKIYQGEDFGVARNNKLLGRFALHGIPPNEAGEEKVDVWMEMNAMGILHVEAVSTSTKQSKQLTVKEDKARMSKETKEEIIKDQQQPSGK